MISKARGIYVSCSPQKARLVADLIRGQQVDQALTVLRFNKKRVARDMEKILNSAIANATSNPDNEGRVDVDRLYVSAVMVDGASLRHRKRIQPQPMGRAFRIVKRQSHITIQLDQKN